MTPITALDPESHSAEIVAPNREKLRELFPAGNRSHDSSMRPAGATRVRSGGSTDMAAWRDELAPEDGASALFRDSAFADDVVKANCAAILEQHGFDKKNIRSL